MSRNLYRPWLANDVVRALYRESQRQRKPMTRLADELVRNALAETPKIVPLHFVANYSKRLGLSGYSSHQFSVCLGDELSPGICRQPTGSFCVIMPMRVTLPAGTNASAAATEPQHARAT